MVDYHTLYDDLNSDILLALKEEAPEAIKPVIANYNVNKRNEDFRKEIISENHRDVLLQTAEFLKCPPKTKNIKTIAKAVTIGIQNLLHELCEKCNQYYVVTLHDTPSLRCQNCHQGAHENCYSVCKGLPGIEWCCSSCNATGPKAEEEVEPKPNAEEVDPKPADPPARGIPQNADNSELDVSAEDKDDEDQTPPKSNNVCPNYKWEACKTFHTCPYDHPARCRSWLQHGKCPYKNKCRFNHPPLCYQSMRERKCSKVNCKFFHLKGTNNTHSKQNAASIPPLMSQYRPHPNEAQHQQKVDAERQAAIHPSNFPPLSANQQHTRGNQQPPHIPQHQQQPIPVQNRFSPLSSNDQPVDGNHQPPSIAVHDQLPTSPENHFLYKHITETNETMKSLQMLISSLITTQNEQTKPATQPPNMVLNQQAPQMQPISIQPIQQSQPMYQLVSNQHS